VPAGVRGVEQLDKYAPSTPCLQPLNYQYIHLYSSMSVQSFREIVQIPPSTASVNDSTLIIVDAQNEYVNGKLATVNIDQTRKAIAEILQKYRSSEHNGKNIVHVVHQTPDGAPVFTPGTALAQELQELTPHSGEKLVVKNFPNSFAKTDLGPYLQSLGSVGKKLVIVGYMAHICVSTTTRAASELGYEVLVAEDGVGDRDIPGVKAANLKDVVLRELADGFATIIKGKDIEQ